MLLNKLRYDLQETATMLSVSVYTVLNRIEDGKILGAYKDGRKWFIPRESIMEYQKKLQNF